jgi:phosphate transport system permease protein
MSATGQSTREQPRGEGGAGLAAERSTQGQDKFFAGLTTGSAIFIMVALAAVAYFLLRESLPAFGAEEEAFPGASGFIGYAWPLVFGTVYAAVLALLAATPLAIAIALYMSHYAPRRLAGTLGYITDLLAAVPSVVYGLWGIFVLAPFLVPVFRFLEGTFGWIPLFAGPVTPTGRTMFTAALVIGVMILPIITAICREIFLQTPRLHEEAALALGATRWEMIKTAVLPYARSGIISGAMLGLGRALGETMAVALILSPTVGLITVNQLAAQNSQTIAANIALRFPESRGLEVSALFATGLVLYVITFLVNYAARRITASRAEFSGAN